MNLIIPISLNCLLVFVVYFADKYLPSNKMPYMARQIVIGILFGCVSAFASSYGVELLGTMVNVRDSAPLSAGLIFGAPAGIISGLIGGLYRWFSVAWGAGTYTRLACTIATIFAGLFAAQLRKLMFDDKKPTVGYGICIAIVCEVIHMLLIFLTNMNDASYAFEFVKGATIPMIIGNSLAVGLSILIISLLKHERLTNRKDIEQIAQTFQRWLLACIVIAYFVTSGFTFILQNGIVDIETQEIFKTAINDVQKDIREKSDEFLLGLVRKIADDYETNPMLSLNYLADKYDVVEINIVSQDGLVLDSTEEDLINTFNMNSTEQSKEFMVLTYGAKSFVQEYGPVGSDGVTMRKFAGVPLKDGGYIQVGYSADQFHAMLNEFVVDVTKNRHVGSNGFIAVCDEQLNLVTEDQYNGKPISSIGIVPNERMLERKSSNDLCETYIVLEEENYNEKYIYVFTFVEGYGIIATMPEVEAVFMRDVSLYTTLFMQVLIFATLFIFIYVLIKKVIINNLRKINNTLAQITEGNLNVTVDVRSNEEFASLSDDINSTVATLKRYITEATARIDKELEYAKQIQLAALPTDFPDNEEYTIHANMIAAKEVGGDFYDFYTINDHTIAFLAADVSGKGIPAAMFMMSAKTIIKDLAEQGLAVNEIFMQANDKLCESNESGMFVTAWMGILDLTTGKLSFANAGHNPPLLKRKDGTFDYLRSKAGFVLAGMEGVPYRINEIEFNPGDRIFLYTDGVTEATDSLNQLYGEKRLLEFMNQHQKVEAKNLLPALKENIDEFVGEAPQFDDITMLMFDYREKNKLSKSFDAKVDCLNEVMAFMEEALEGYGCSMKLQMAICVAIEEVFVNVANYAYPNGQGDVNFDLSFDAKTRLLTIQMEDGGVPFDPLKKPDPDITLNAQDREIGGLGIFITKKTMDEIFYQYENQKNRLTMIKKI